MPLNNIYLVMAWTTMAHLLAFICARAGLHYVKGTKVEWIKLERGGSNTVPPPVPTNA